MADRSFFEEPAEQSKVKSAIVAKYFYVWANVIKSSVRRQESRLAYVDLFAGPGKYGDGTESTPLKVLRTAIKDQELCDVLVTIFNDKDRGHCEALREAIALVPGINQLKYQPRVLNEEVGDQIVSEFSDLAKVPKLFFVDPFGYKGLSPELINTLTKEWACECLFFFNYNRISMGLNNPTVREHMDALFGVDGAKALRHRIESSPAADRELLIVEELSKALKAPSFRYVLPFRFKDDRGTRTSHHLIFVSKEFKGYEIMKEIMAKESSGREDGVSSFEYNPVDAQQAGQQQLLFGLSGLPEDLADMLTREFAGQRVTMYDIYRRHSVDRPYIKKNYKEVLLKLEKEGKISASKHQKGTFGDGVLVTFPSGEARDVANGR